MAAVIDSDDHTGLKEAYDKLVSAQNALAEAEDVLGRTQYILDLDEQADYEDRLSAMEEQIQDLNGELVKAKNIRCRSGLITRKAERRTTEHGAR